MHNDWKFKWNAFLSDEPQIQEVLVEVAKLSKEPTEQQVKDLMDEVGRRYGMEKMHSRDVVNREIYQGLCMNLEEGSSALGIMKNLSDLPSVK